MDATMWNDRYGASELIWGKGPNQFLAPLVEDLTPGRALDVASGEGRNAIWLARQGWDVTAVDFSQTGIDKARTLASDTVVDWVVGDVTSYEPDGVFDLVVVFYLHLMPSDLADAFSMATAALAPGGTFFGVGHALANLTDGYGGPAHPEVLWTEELIAPMVEGLSVVELGERLRPVPDADATAIDLVVHATAP